MDGDDAVADEGKDVGRVVEDREGRGGKHSLAPGFQFGGLGVGGVVVEGKHVVTEDGPEGVSNSTAKGGAMEEAPDARIAVGGALDAGAKPGKQPYICRVLVGVWTKGRDVDLRTSFSSYFFNRVI